MFAGFLVSASGDGRVGLLSMDGSNKTFEVAAAAPLTAMLTTIVNGTEMMVTGGPGGELQIFNLHQLQAVASAPGHTAPVNCMVAGPEGSNTFFTGSADR